MIRFNEKLFLHGILSYKVFKAGKLIEEYSDHNLIVDAARFQMAHFLAGDVKDRHITTIVFGTNGNIPLLTDSAIVNGFVKTISGFQYTANNTVQFDWELSISENNGMAIMEFGLLCADGTLFARRTREEPLNKASDISIEGHWAINF